MSYLLEYVEGKYRTVVGRQSRLPAAVRLAGWIAKVGPEHDGLGPYDGQGRYLLTVHDNDPDSPRHVHIYQVLEPRR